MTMLTTVDESTEPFLSGRYAPVHDELDVTDLTVDGTLPTDLTGAYLRNGPNPEFPPLGSYTYPLEGDGMLHGVWFEQGRARYANRFVRTQSLRAEERAGRALFGGLMTPAFVDTSLLGDDPDPTWPFKLDADINIVRHAGRLLALAEGAPPYEVSASLDTLARVDFAGALPLGITAHPKIDPRTGEMFVFRYDVTAPFLTWAVVGPDGSVTRPPTPVAGVDAAFMIHDFAITARFLVVVLGPFQLDVDALLAGGQPLVWKPELGTRVALIPRDGSPVRWVHGDAFWAWHYANAFDDGDLVQLDFPWSSAPGLGLLGPHAAPTTGSFARATLDPAGGTIDVHHLDDLLLEFPRIDDRLVGARHRYVVVAGRSDDPAVRSGEHDQVHRYDMDTGSSLRYDGHAALGEPIFVPRDGGTDELDGYHLAYAGDLTSDRTSLLVFDAAHFPDEPIATIHMPRRVPNGLHGSWIPAR
jgi:carotenoid cleavage dioxygenase-like enzyme